MCGKWKRRWERAKKRSVCVCVCACMCVLVWARMWRGQEWSGRGKHLFKRTPPSVVSSPAHSGNLSPWERDQLSLGENMQRSSSVSFQTICISGLKQTPLLLHLFFSVNEYAFWFYLLFYYSFGFWLFQNEISSHSHFLSFCPHWHLHFCFNYPIIEAIQPIYSGNQGFKCMDLSLPQITCHCDWIER